MFFNGTKLFVDGIKLSKEAIEIVGLDFSNYSLNSTTNYYKLMPEFFSNRSQPREIKKVVIASHYGGQSIKNNSIHCIVYVSETISVEAKDCEPVNIENWSIFERPKQRLSNDETFVIRQERPFFLKVELVFLRPMITMDLELM